jgi:ABC-type branched-subunit amino acid transport system substrate-binding protein
MLGLAALAGCTGIDFNDALNRNTPPENPVAPPPGGAAGAPIGNGQVRAALILPLTASGNAGAVGQSMRNAAELALAEFNAPNVQLLVKDDAGNAQTAQQAAQQALDEGAEIILGPLFAQSVQAAGQVARSRRIPVIAFSTDTSVAGRGVYLLSFLPESDVDRIVGYALSQGKHSFVAMLPDNAYGSVVEAAFQQAVSRGGGRVLAVEHYGGGNSAQAARNIAQAAAGADALFIPDDGETVPGAVRALIAAGANIKKLQLLGTGLWNDPRIFAAPELQGAWFPGADVGGFNSFVSRYRAKYGDAPARTATLSYDAVALVAALVKTQGGQRFAAETLTNSSGFAGIDGVFRFRPDGTNQRGLAVLKVTPSGAQVIAPPPKSFGNSAI